MKFEELMEGLPDDWDKSVYQHPTSFKNMIAYAKERAEQVGRGSSRVAFKIIYQGRPTVLKINLTRKGVAQTQAEVNLLADTYLRNSPIIIPLIDYDVQNSAPTWIHTEFAEKITKRQLESLFNNVPMDQIIRYLRGVRGEQGYDNSTLPEEIFQNENFVEFQDLILNFTNIALGDLERKANWGLYKGRPVIIDLGITKEVYADFYRR